MVFIERYMAPESKGRHLGVFVRFAFWRPTEFPTAETPVVGPEACFGGLLTAPFPSPFWGECSRRHGPVATRSSPIPLVAILRGIGCGLTPDSSPPNTWAV